MTVAAPRPAIGRLRTPPTPTFCECELAGGLQAVAVRRRGIPLVELRLVFPLSARRLSRPSGPLLLSESVLSGTGVHDREELAAAVERLGGTLTASVDGDCLELCASALADRLRALLALVNEVLVGATYPAAEVRAVRARSANEVVLLLSRPEVIADEALAKRLFAAHPYGSGIPRPETLGRIGASELRRLHRETFTAHAAHLVLVGDLQPRRALTLAETELAAWLESSHVGEVQPQLPPIPAIRPGPLRLIDRPGSVQSNLRLGGPAPDRSCPDWPASALANVIIGGMFTSRLVENLRERHGYTYSPRSTISHGRAGSTTSIAAEVSTEATAAAIVETRYELGRAATGGVTDEEVEAARRYTIGSFLFQTATQAGLASLLAKLARVGLGPDYLSTYPKLLARAKRADVTAAARRYFSPSSMVTVVVGDANAVVEPLSLLDTVTTSDT
jgi:predicted Zn-dependent peptidase